MWINIPLEIKRPGYSLPVLDLESADPYIWKFTDNGLVLIPKQPPAPQIEEYIKIR